MKTNLDVTYYYVINDDLKMSKGKIAAQVSHVAMMLGEQYKEVGRAVVLKAPEAVLQKLKTIKGFYYVEDAGFTQCPPGSLTCVGFMSTVATEDIMKITKELKLV